ncbi:hypothetical protein RhiirA4_475703 [Rhizophagus irregularis]|uniref:Uncharacterized protein n=1 Tax=Rhizophagus irregularis TaxID=588596 RepID=A0A2I1HAH8_9GLOM|nr:hypothetical protein RhiirA4_475703 [Rhizophagus irregularis]
MTFQLGQFVENGFLKKLFDKSPLALDKTALLVEMFGSSANPNNFAQQAVVTNIQPTTLSLLFSIALYASYRSWDNFATCAIANMVIWVTQNRNVPSLLTNLVIKSENYTTILPDVEITPVDQTVTPETFRKKDKQKARVTDDKQVLHQSFTANPDVQTPAHKPLLLGAKTSAPGVTHILTGYKKLDGEREQVRDIIVYDIPYTWNVEKVLSELTNTPF